MSTAYIDEAAGSDKTGKGTQQLPFKSLTFAMYSSDGLDNTKYLIRKDTTTDYDEATQPALKKAEKGADGIEEKREEVGGLGAREDSKEKPEREEKEKLLEESEKIVLEEDPALPKATKVGCTVLALFSSRRLTNALHRRRSGTLIPTEGRVSVFPDGFRVA